MGNILCLLDCNEMKLCLYKDKAGKKDWKGRDVKRMCRRGSYAGYDTTSVGRDYTLVPSAIINYAFIIKDLPVISEEEMKTTIDKMFG